MTLFKKVLAYMSEIWLQDYIFLAFRLHKATTNTYGSPFVEEYWGPASWRTQVEAEPERAGADIVRQAMALTDTLPVQGFTPNREAYLGKHLRAMETIARKLCGETFRLAEEAARCLDIHPMWTSETQFEGAHALYERVLPGIGSLAERLRTYSASVAYPPEQVNLLPAFIDLAFAEVRKRTTSLVELPEDETIEIEYRPEWEHEVRCQVYAASRRPSHHLRHVFKTSTHWTLYRADLWERTKTGATLVAGDRQRGRLPSFLDRAMDALTISSEHLA